MQVHCISFNSWTLSERVPDKFLNIIWCSARIFLWWIFMILLANGLQVASVVSIKVYAGNNSKFINFRKENTLFRIMRYNLYNQVTKLSKVTSKSYFLILANESVTDFLKLYSVSFLFVNQIFHMTPEERSHRDLHLVNKVAIIDALGYWFAYLYANLGFKTQY